MTDKCRHFMSSAFHVTESQLAVGIAWIWALSCIVQCIHNRAEVFFVHHKCDIIATSLAVAVVTGFRSKCAKCAPSGPRSSTTYHMVVVLRIHIYLHAMYVT
jgi:hypothetical protein